MNIIPNIVKAKLHLCASGSILLPLAQKWGLVGVVAALSAFGAQSASAASLTLEIPTTPLTVNSSATLNDGFAEASGKVSVKGEAYWGYILTIKTKSGSNDLVSTDNNGNKISSITEDKSKANFPDNSWGYKFGKDNTDITNSNFKAGPIGETQIDKTETSGEHDYTFTIGAKVNEEQPAGTYSNTFVVTVTAETVDYSITYQCKEGATCPNQVGKSTEQSITLNSPAPTREGYEFQGYCTKEALSEKLCTSASGKRYNPGDTYTLNKGSSNTMTLYAMWKPTTMQTFSGYCNALEMEEDILNLRDVRDNKIYSVAKLLDGNCWMTQNLAIGSNKEEIVLKPETSDVDVEFTLPKGDTKTGSTTDKNSGWADMQFDTKHIWISEDADYAKQYGGYYTWFVATVGEGKEEKESGDTEHSICPKGWRLPTNIEFNTIVDKYDATTSQQSPANFIRAGRCDGNGCPTRNETYGYWWSSTAVNNEHVHTLYSYNLRFFVMDDGYNKGVGNSVRCVARE